MRAFLSRFNFGKRTAFPLPFRFVSVLDKSEPARHRAGFLIATMFTDAYRDRALRLGASCERLGLPHVIYETETVHNSISGKGTPDLRFTKANFIHFLLHRYRRPILYVDADCVFHAYPRLVDRLLRDGTTFAIYNWAADRQNEGFIRIEMKRPGRIVTDQYYGYYIRVNSYSETQLLCSGAVQLYADTPATRALLQLWHNTIRRFPASADDNCLNFAFNNGGSGIAGLKAYWLPKAYVRCPWWIYIKPVIDHPDQRAANAATQFVRIPDDQLEKEFYPERAPVTQPRFSENCMIDIKAMLLYEVTHEKVVLVGPAYHNQFWT